MFQQQVPSHSALCETRHPLTQARSCRSRPATTLQFPVPEASAGRTQLCVRLDGPDADSALAASTEGVNTGVNNAGVITCEGSKQGAYMVVDYAAPVASPAASPSPSPSPKVGGLHHRWPALAAGCEQVHCCYSKVPCRARCLQNTWLAALTISVKAGVSRLPTSLPHKHVLGRDWTPLQVSPSPPPAPVFSDAPVEGESKLGFTMASSCGCQEAARKLCLLPVAGGGGRDVWCLPALPARPAHAAALAPAQHCCSPWRLHPALQTFNLDFNDLAADPVAMEDFKEDIAKSFLENVAVGGTAMQPPAGASARLARQRGAQKHMRL